jgi:hypothetical protein
MPSRPVHAASSKGKPLRLELTGSISADPSHSGYEDGRIRIFTHTNAYMGQLRRQIASIAKTEAPRIRLFYCGALPLMTWKLYSDRAVLSIVCIQHSGVNVLNAVGARSQLYCQYVFV